MKSSTSLKINVSEKMFLPVYRRLLNHPADVHFLWGGRDSGKSHFIASKMLLDCLREPVFRCILVKKTFESIKDAQFQTLRDIATQWKIDHLFEFTKSPLEIRCVVNGNKFIARGCDKPEKIKSISNPTHAWFEEANQLTRDDIIVVSTTLRSSDTSVKQWYSFNPESAGDYHDHWLWRYFGDHYERGIKSFESQISVDLPNHEPIKIDYTSTHTTYRDNVFCTPERIATLHDLKNIDPYYFDVFVNGLFGLRKNENPFVFSYDPDKHDGRPKLNQNETIYLSFDFNRNPICCSVIQHYDEHIRVIKTYKIPNSDIYELCERINSDYPNGLFIVTGDATGRAGSALVKGNVNYYIEIQRLLNLGSMQIKVPSVNPSQNKNRMLVNSVLANYKTTIHVDDADALIYDFKNVKQRADGTVEKGNRDDPTQQADALDTWRYWCNTFMSNIMNVI